MDKFQYEILTSVETPQGPAWISGSTGAGLGLNLVAILNQLGQQGWEMIGGLDVTRSNRSEIFLKKRIG